MTAVGGPRVAVTNRRLSATAVASVVVGLLGCVPYSLALVSIVFGGVGALALGGVGVAATRSPAVRGRGLAVLGMVLGVACIGGWSVHIARHGIAPAAATRDAPDPAVARTFFTRLSEGDVAKATALCKAGTDAADVQVTADQMRPFGPVVAFQTSDTSPHGDRTMVDGTIRFRDGGVRRFDAVVEQGPGSNPVIQSWGLH